jgi:hypothetical protein
LPSRLQVAKPNVRKQGTRYHDHGGVRFVAYAVMRYRRRGTAVVAVPSGHLCDFCGYCSDPAYQERHESAVQRVLKAPGRRSGAPRNGAIRSWRAASEPSHA